LGQAMAAIAVSKASRCLREGRRLRLLRRIGWR
jgi:hypothetical protein